MSVEFINKEYLVGFVTDNMIAKHSAATVHISDKSLYPRTENLTNTSLITKERYGCIPVAPGARLPTPNALGSGHFINCKSINRKYK